MVCTGSGHGSSMLGSACICKQMSLQCSQNIQRPSHIIPVCKPHISLTYLVPLKSTSTYVGCRRSRRSRRSRRNHRSRRSRRNRRSRRSRRSEQAANIRWQLCRNGAGEAQQYPHALSMASSISPLHKGSLIPALQKPNFIRKSVFGLRTGS